MANEHIKALKQIIKLNDRNGLPILKCMAHSNGTLKATNLTQIVEVEIPTIDDGIWNETALDYGFRDDTKNTEFTLADYPEVEQGKLIQEVELDETDMAKIIRASEFVSNDLTRPVLTGVVLKGGHVYGTDGYKMYRDKISQEVTEMVNIPKDCVRLLKTVKADKQGTWVMSVYEDDQVVFTHGKFKLHTKTLYGNIPEYDRLIDNARHYQYMVRVDMKQVKAKKTQVLWGDVDEQKLYVANEDGTDKILISECLTICEDELPDTPHREVVMPLADRQHIVIKLEHLKMYKGKIDIYVDNIGMSPVNIEEL